MFASRCRNTDLLDSEWLVDPETTERSLIIEIKCYNEGIPLLADMYFILDCTNKKSKLGEFLRILKKSFINFGITKAIK